MGHYGVTQADFLNHPIELKCEMKVANDFQRQIVRWKVLPENSGMILYYVKKVPPPYPHASFLAVFLSVTFTSARFFKIFFRRYDPNI